MTDLREFEQDVREDLLRTAQAVQVPAGAIDRAIRAARAQELSESPTSGGVSSWVRPMAAAAAVLMIVGGVALATQWPFGDDARPTHRPTPTFPAPTPTPTTSATSGLTKPRPGAPVSQAHAVSVGDATLTLPTGWSSTFEADQSGAAMSTWCIHPSGQSFDAASCPVDFRELTAAAGDGLDPNVQGGFVSNPEYCGQVTHWTDDLVDDADKPFGARTADFRRWFIRCPDGKVWNVEQYVVTTVPGFMVTTDHADSATRQMLASIATSAVVPAQSLPLRLTDTGIVRSVVHRADGDHIALDRVDTGAPNASSRTYLYVIPDGVLLGNGSDFTLKVGDLIYLATDGRHVVDVKLR